MAVTRIRYSEAFKLQAVSAFESEPRGSLNAVCLKYGIGSVTTLARWVRRYGSEDKLPRNVRIETLKERDELKDAKKRIRELEAAVADAHIDFCLERAYLDEACDRLGVNSGTFKKKHAMTLSSVRNPKRGR